MNRLIWLTETSPPIGTLGIIIRAFIRQFLAPVSSSLPPLHCLSLASLLSLPYLHSSAHSSIHSPLRFITSILPLLPSHYQPAAFYIQHCNSLVSPPSPLIRISFLSPPIFICAFNLACFFNYLQVLRVIRPRYLAQLITLANLQSRVLK